MKSFNSKKIGGTLLIAGTAIGAGMLAAPIATGASGITSALLLLCLMCAFTLTTLFVFLEAIYFVNNPAVNLVGLCRKLSGPITESIAWALFLSLLYVVSAAYIVGAGTIIASTHASLQGYTLICSTLFSAIFAFIACFGMHWIDLANRAFTIALALLFIALVYAGAPHVTIDNLSGGEPGQIVHAIPAVITAFTYQIILPSIRQYLDNDLKAIKQTVTIGCLIPLTLYVIWHLIILGLVPYTGPNSLTSILQGQKDPLEALIIAVDQAHNLSNFGQLIAGFSFFAIATSFWGVMISLKDFIFDGISLSRFQYGKHLSLALSFLPPTLLAIVAPSDFLGFVKYAGMIITILYGLLPVYLVWIGRYKLNLVSEYQLPGGKPALILIGVLALSLLFISIG